MEVLELTVPPEGAGERLDKWISTQVEGVSRSAAQKFCEEGLVEAAGKALSKNYKLRGGEALCLTIPDPVELDVTPEDIPLDIVYEDPSLLVVNKPKGMVVHPAYGNLNHTLVNALLYHCKGQLSGINGVIRPGIVHRIDKDTSGLLVVAKDDQAHSSLAAQIKEHSFDRFYHAVVYGNLKEDSGTVHQPIGRHPTDRKRWQSPTKTAGMPSPILRWWSGTRGLPTSASSLRPAVLTKFVSTWPTSAIRWQGTRSTAPGR